MIGGFGRATLVSCVQYTGMEPRYCTKDAKRPAWSSTICSTSTSFATLPSSSTPRLRYRVPANKFERRPMSVIVRGLPKMAQDVCTHSALALGRGHLAQHAGSTSPV